MDDNQSAKACLHKDAMKRLASKSCYNSLPDPLKSEYLVTKIAEHFSDTINVI